MNELISVIIPVYKVEKYIHICVDSIICQTHKNIEIILVDDGSPDNCGVICDEYAQKDHRVMVIHKANGGLSSARNAALDVFKGEYVMFVDGDDYVEPTFCEEALRLVCEKKVLCASFGYYEIRNEQRKPNGTHNPRYLGSEEAIERIIKLDDVIYNMACNKIYHRSLFEKIRYPIGRLFEDQGTTYKLFDLAGKIYVSNVPLYDYLRRDDSITAGGGTAKTTSAKGLNDIFDLWHERLLYIEKRYPRIKITAIKQIVELIVRAFHVLSWQKDKSLIIKFEGFLNEHKKDIQAMDNKSRLLRIFYSKFWLYRIFIWCHSFFMKL